MNIRSLTQWRALSQGLDGLSKALKIVLLGGLIIGQTGCATSEEDLGYTTAASKAAAAQQNHTPDNSGNGWNAPLQ
jgi:hypothetical protein